MTRFDVFRDPRGAENLLMIMQADVFERLGVRFCLPLLPDHPKLQPLLRLNPAFVIDERRFVIRAPERPSGPSDRQSRGSSR